MFDDAKLHLLVQGLGRGHIDPLKAGGEDQLLRKARFAGTSAANNERVAERGHANPPASTALSRVHSSSVPGRPNLSQWG